MKLAAAVLLAFASVTAPAAADPLSSLRFLVGTWKCTYQAGRTHVYYKAMFTFDLGNNWLRENDSWTGGGADLGMITYQPARGGWIAVVFDDKRAAVVFHAAGSNPNRIVYRSVYPDTTLTDIFERISPTRYTLHFTQGRGRRSAESTDVCVKT
jgi:hypothetical protein